MSQKKRKKQRVECNRLNTEIGAQTEFQFHHLYEEVIYAESVFVPQEKKKSILIIKFYYGGYLRAAVDTHEWNAHVLETC